jgi:hypothetical protein
MIYSRWRPDTGGYDYFESPERYALADDLPTPSVFGGSAIGVSSLACGRKIPMGARPAGSGASAKGVIAPVSRAGLSGVGQTLLSAPTWLWALGGAAAGLAGGIIWRRRRG